MKRTINFLALLVMLTVNLLTPISYAQEEKKIEKRVKEDIVAEKEGVVLTLIKDVNRPEEKELIEIGDKGFDYMYYSRREAQDGVEFADWYDNINLQGEPFDFNNIKQNITLYAKWTKKISYQNGVIKLSDGKKSILVKSVNEGGNVSDVNKFKRIMEMKNDESYCNYKEECYSDSRSCYSVFVCTPDFFTEVSNVLGKTVENLEQVDEYFTSIYGRYYFRGNNGYVEYNELIPVENGFRSEVSIDQNAQDRGFLNYSKILQPDIGWRENDSSKNPCDVTKGEYLPTPEDWRELINIWNDINGMNEGKIMDLGTTNEIDLAPVTKNGLDSNGSIGVINSSIFQQDFLIPAAGSVEYDNKNRQVKFRYYSSPSFLWTSISDNGKFGWFDVEKGRLYWGNVVEYSASPIRCFVLENPVTVEFNTNGGSNIESYKVAEGNTIKSPDIPLKNGYTFEGWYKDRDLTQQWNFDKDEVKGNKVTLYAKWRMCGNGFMVKNNMCVPNDMDKEGIIMVSDGVNTVFIKDRNVGAESKCSSELYQLIELSEKRCPTFVGPIGGGEIHKSPSKGLDSTCISDEDFFMQVNDIVKNIEINNDIEFDNYINSNMQKCAGNYYFRGNNVGVSYEGLEIDNSDAINFIVNSNELFESGFNGGRLGTVEGSGWEQGNINNPCDATKGEYLPTPEDWAALMKIWGKNNGYIVNESVNDEFDVIDEPIYKEEPIYNEEKESIYHEDLEEIAKRGIVEESKDSSSLETLDMKAIEKGGYKVFSDIEANNKFQRDMLIPSLGRILYNCEVEGQSNRGIKGNCIDKMYYEFGDGLWSAQNINGYVGIFSKGGVQYDIFENVNNNFRQELNNIALPVRCFVNMSESFVITLISDGKVDKEINVKKGDVIKEPKGSLKPGVLFEGWYTESGKKYDFNTPITEDIILYARWTSSKGEKYSGGGGGKGSLDSSNITYDKVRDSLDEKNIKTSAVDDVKLDKKEIVLDDRQNVSNDTTKQTVDAGNNGSVKLKEFNTEFKEAYNYAKQNGITTKSSINEAGMYSPLTRIQMAKMLSNYAINVLGREPNISKGMVNFVDVTDKMNNQYDYGVTLAYQLGIMGINMPNNKFRPDDVVTRAEFASAFSRMLYGTSDGKYEFTSKYYTNHMQKLKQEGIISNTTPNMKELRGYVMIMLKRSVAK